MGSVGGIGKQSISWKSEPENWGLNLILYIPGRVQHKFQAPFKMIFLEKNALDCEILIGNRPSAFNENKSANVSSILYSNNFLSD